MNVAVSNEIFENENKTNYGSNMKQVGNWKLGASGVKRFVIIIFYVRIFWYTMFSFSVYTFNIPDMQFNVVLIFYLIGTDNLKRKK